MKVALVHDWLIHMRGGEKVLEALAEMYPDAVIHTLFYRRKKLSPVLKSRRMKASFLHYLPGIEHYYRWLLPLYPWAVSTLDTGDADVVISSSHCAAKAVRAGKALHICYCHTPMRYLYGFGEDYFGKMPGFIRPLVDGILGRLRAWDVRTSRGVDVFAANSENVRGRIREHYAAGAEVIWPPVDTDFFQPGAEANEDFYLVVSAFVPYKRVDLVIEAFNGLDRRLCVAGSGPLERDCRRMARSPKISFLGAVSDAELKRLYSRARALVFPTEEDFGIVPVEAQACGTPVIAFAKGGARETVASGVFFEEQSPEAVRQAVLRFEAVPFDRGRVRSQVLKFGRENFKQKIRQLAEHCLRERVPAGRSPVPGRGKQGPCGH